MQININKTLLQKKKTGKRFLLSFRHFHFIWYQYYHLRSDEFYCLHFFLFHFGDLLYCMTTLTVYVKKRHRKTMSIILHTCSHIVSLWSGRDKH